MGKLKKYLYFISNATIFTVVIASSLISQQSYEPGQIIVKFKSPFQFINQGEGGVQTNKTYFNSFAQQYSVSKIEKLYSDNADNADLFYVISFSTVFSIENAVTYFNGQNDVSYAEPNCIFEGASTNDPLSSVQWAIEKAKFNTAHQKYFSGNSNIVIAVFDTGIDMDLINNQSSHPDLDNRLWVNNAEKNGLTGIDDDNNKFIDDINGFDFDRSQDLNGDGIYDQIFQPNDNSVNSHGTAVCGIIGANTNNSIGISGAAGGGYRDETGVKIMILKVLDNQAKHGNVMALCRAMRYARLNGADIFNLSLSKPMTDFCSLNSLHDEIKLFNSKGRDNLGGIIVVASGNDNINSLRDIAIFDEVISVRSIQDDNVLMGNYGNGLDLLAPGGYGQGVITTNRRLITQNYGYGYFGGTSAAAPYVAALAGLLLSVQPDLTSTFVYGILTETSSNASNYNTSSGFGLIDAEKALRRLMSPVPQNVSIQNFNGHPKINWSGDIIDEHYNIYRRISGGDFAYLTTVIAPNNYFIDYQVNVQTKKPYSNFADYFVVAYGGEVWKNVSGQSNVVSIQTNMAEKVLMVQTNNNNMAFDIAQNFPNPFNPETIIELSIPETQFISLKVYSGIGQEIATILNEIKSAGIYKLKFNGSHLPSGIYFYSLKAGNTVETRKMILQK